MLGGNLMDKLGELKKTLEESRPAPWDMFPDIALYMDQVVSYMTRQLVGFDGDTRLTPAMVNNYIKDGLLPRAEGKKYGKEHIAYLTAICMFKQVIPVRDIAPLLEAATKDGGIEPFYDTLTSLIDNEMTKVSQKITEEPDEAQISSVALELLVSAYCSQFLCKRLIEMLDTNDSLKNRKKRKEK